MELTVQKREILGRAVKSLRKEGLIPAELYGRGLENLHLSVSVKEFNKVFKEAGENTIVNVSIDGKIHPVFIYDVSYHPVTDEVRSVDFYQIKMDEKLTVSVPLEFVGVAPAVKEKNGLLVKALQEIEVEALPTDIPHDIKVDLSKLIDIDQSIYVESLEVPADIEILLDPETVVVSVTAKVTEEEELIAQETAAVPPEEVKVEAEEKKAERESEKEAASGDKGTTSKEETK